MMRRAVLRATRRRRRHLSDALPAASGGVGVSPAVRDQTQFEQLRAEAERLLGTGSALRFDGGWSTSHYVYRNGLPRFLDFVPVVGLVTSAIDTPETELVLLFDPDGFEILWQAASFEANFIRALVIDWIKLSFLGMLGIAAATFLSFPVAILLAFTVFIGGSMTPFISTSIDQFRPKQDATAVVWFFQTVISAVARTVEWLLRPFGQSSPNRLVIEGRLVSVSSMIQNLFVIGIFWSGATLSVAWAVFRRRELATYSGHG